MTDFCCTKVSIKLKVTRPVTLSVILYIFQILYTKYKPQLQSQSPILNKTTFIAPVQSWTPGKSGRNFVIYFKQIEIQISVDSDLKQTLRMRWDMPNHPLSWHFSTPNKIPIFEDEPQKVSRNSVSHPHLNPSGIQNTLNTEVKKKKDEDKSEIKSWHKMRTE